MSDKAKPCKFVCKSCQSENILADAYAEWNAETQKWELHSAYDALVCNDCGGDSVEEVEL